LAADAVTMANQMAQNSGVACQSSNTGCTQQWQFGTAAGTANKCSNAPILTILW
jgi:hypothetical protein